MTSAIVRADGSSALGMGHIIRCLTFADRLRADGVEAIFLTKVWEPATANLIRSKRYVLEELPLEGSAEEEARLTCDLARRVDAAIIVTDLCHSAAMARHRELNAYHGRLSREFFTVVLAGGDMLDIPGHILVSPYFRTTSPTLPSEGERQILVGPAYFIFRPEFLQAAQVSRSIAREARHVLLTIGGGDELHLTPKVVKALLLLKAPGLSIRVVIGPAFSHELKSEVQTLLEGFTGECRLLTHDANMADAMLGADLAITGDGLTKYETAVTGTPSIMLSSDKSERGLNKEFERAGTTFHAGDGSRLAPEELAEKILSVLQDASMRKSMSEHGKAMTDGQGVERIMAAISSRAVHPRVVS